MITGGTNSKKCPCTFLERCRSLLFLFRVSKKSSLNVVFFAMKRTRQPTQLYVAEPATRTTGGEFSVKTCCTNCRRHCEGAYCEECSTLRAYDMLFLRRANISVRWACPAMWYDGIVRDVRIEPAGLVSHQIYYPVDGDVQWHILADEEVVLPVECREYDKSAKYDATSLTCSKTKRQKTRQRPPPLLVADDGRECMLDQPAVDEREPSLPLHVPSHVDDLLESPMLDDSHETHDRSTYEMHIRHILTSDHPFEDLTCKIVRRKLEARLMLKRDALKPRKRIIATIVDDMMKSLSSSPIANSAPAQVDYPETTTTASSFSLDACPFYNAISRHLSPAVARELTLYCHANNISNAMRRSLVSNLRRHNGLAELVEKTAPETICAWSPDDMKTPQEMSQKMASRTSYHKWHTRDVDDESVSASQPLGDIGIPCTSQQLPTALQLPMPYAHANNETMDESMDPRMTPTRGSTAACKALASPAEANASIGSSAPLAVNFTASASTAAPASTAVPSCATVCASTAAPSCATVCASAASASTTTASTTISTLNQQLNDCARNTDDVRWLRKLVDKGGDVASTNGEPWHHTPLHQACYWNRIAIASELLELGAYELCAHLPSNPCGRGPSAGTPIELARGGGHSDVVRLLEEYASRHDGGREEPMETEDATMDEDEARSTAMADTTDLSVDAESTKVQIVAPFVADNAMAQTRSVPQSIPQWVPPSKDSADASSSAYLAYGGPGLEDDLLRTMTDNPEKAAFLFGSSGNVLRDNLLRQIHAAGGDVDATRRAIVRAYRKLMFNWFTYEEKDARPKQGVTIYGIRMYRPD